MLRRFLSPALFLVLACRGSRDEHDRLVAADGKRHYTTYTAAGEVEDTKGVIDIYAFTGANALSPSRPARNGWSMSRTRARER